MKRLWRLWLCLTLLLLVGASLLHPSVQWRLIGWVRGEAFFQGRPTSFWKRECRQWEHRLDENYGMSCVVPWVWVRNPTELEQRIGQWTGRPAAKTAGKMPLLEGGPLAVPVIVELTGEDDRSVVHVALCGVAGIMIDHPDAIEPAVRSALVPKLQRIAQRCNSNDSQFHAGRQPHFHQPAG